MKELNILFTLTFAALLLCGKLWLDLCDVTKQKDRAEQNEREAWAMVQEMRASKAQGWEVSE